MTDSNATSYACEYCEHGEPMQARIIDGESGWPEIYVENSDLVYTNGNYECVFSAKFCPMCGADLQKEGGDD